MNAGGIPARRPAPSWVTSEASPWTSVGARTMLAPNAAAMDCMPRHTPRSGSRRARRDPHGLDRDPGVIGIARPGRDHDPAQVCGRVVRQCLHLADVDGVVPDDADLCTSGLQRLDEVEREAVVVVDDQDHGWGLASVAGLAGDSGRAASGTPAAISIARRSAAALCSVSSNSRSGTDPATMPAPVWTCAWPSFRTALRIVIAVSRLPS